MVLLQAERRVELKLTKKDIWSLDASVPADVAVPSGPDNEAVALVSDEELLAVYRRDGDLLKPDVVLATPLTLEPVS